MPQEIETEIGFHLRLCMVAKRLSFIHAIGVVLLNAKLRANGHVELNPNQPWTGSRVTSRIQQFQQEKCNVKQYVADIWIAWCGWRLKLMSWNWYGKMHVYNTPLLKAHQRPPSQNNNCHVMESRNHKVMCTEWHFSLVLSLSKMLKYIRKCNGREIFRERRLRQNSK